MVEEAKLYSISDKIYNLDSVNFVDYKTLP